MDDAILKMDEVVAETKVNVKNAQKKLHISLPYVQETLNDIQENLSSMTECLDAIKKATEKSMTNKNETIAFLRKQRKPTRDNVCSTCDAAFLNQAELQSHATIHLQPARPNVCENCDAAFTTAEQLQNHVTLHQQEQVITTLLVASRRFICDICDAAFGLADALNTHYMMHEEMSFRNASEDDDLFAATQAAYEELSGQDGMQQDTKDIGERTDGVETDQTMQPDGPDANGQQVVRGENVVAVAV